MRIIDISVSVDHKLPLWPNSSGFKIKNLSKISKRSPVTESHIELNAHVGTHVDAPLHFVKNGKSIEKSALDIFIGPVLVASLPKINKIDEEDLKKLSIPRNTIRILFKTDNSKLWGKTKKFKKDYVGLTADGAKWLVKRGVKLVGIDYLSIAKFEEAVGVHQILLGNDVHILETLNLSKVNAGQYELVCLPIKISSIEAAPTRAILIAV